MISHWRCYNKCRANTRENRIARHRLPNYLSCNAIVTSISSSFTLVKETWVQSCDFFFVASDVTDDALNAVAIQTKCEQNRKNLCEKNRKGLRYFYYKNISQPYDWILKAYTDAYEIMGNWKAVLASLDMSRAQLVDHWLNTGLFISFMNCKRRHMPHPLRWKSNRLINQLREQGMSCTHRIIFL